MKDWRVREKNREARTTGKWLGKSSLRTSWLPPEVIRPYDRVCLEGDNQKQADELARALAEVDSGHVHDLRLAVVIVLPEHLDLFDKRIARRLDYSYSGPSILTSSCLRIISSI